MAIRIVSDSSSNLLELSDVDYKTVPLKVMFGGKEYVDEIGTDAEKMVYELQDHKGPSTTSCPNVAEWLDAFEGSDEIFAITISSGLSASFASAETAARQYMEAHPGAQVNIFDSLATGPVERLIIERLRDGVLAGKTYDEILEDTKAYQKNIRILYSLASLNNLARNGRVPLGVSLAAGVLNIRMVGHASDEGKVDIIHKCRGEQRGIKAVVKEMIERGCKGGKVHIDHCVNESAARSLKKLIEEQIPACIVHINPCTVLCSYYADKGGLIIGYEVQAAGASA